MAKTAKATDLKKNEHDVPAGKMMIRVEGTREFMTFAVSRLDKYFSQAKGPVYESQPGETAHHYMLDVSDRSVFMAVWKHAKSEFPKAFPSVEKVKKTRPDAHQIDEAQKALNSAEVSLQRAVERINQQGRSATYLTKNVSAMRGAHRRAHRALVLNQRDALELAAFFEDQACTRPRKLAYRPKPYKDHNGRAVKRQACYESALLHWADIVKSNSLAVHIGSVTPDYAARMVRQFGSLEAFLSHLRVGDTTAMRLPVIERALAQLRKIPRGKFSHEIVEAYHVATTAVKEFADWLELVNAMFHSDILRLLESVLCQKKGVRLSQLLDEALETLDQMRNRLIKARPRDTDAPLRSRRASNTPYVISVCSPDEEEAA